MSPEQSYQELKQEQSNLAFLLEKTRSFIDESTAERRQHLERAVQAHLPTLTASVCGGIAELFPAFLTEARIGRFKQHGKVLGLFNRRTTRAATRRLQAEFRAFLVESGYSREADEGLRKLAIQEENLNRELQLVVATLTWRDVPKTPAGTSFRLVEGDRDYWREVKKACAATSFPVGNGERGDSEVACGDSSSSQLLAALMNSSQDGGADIATDSQDGGQVPSSSETCFSDFVATADAAGSSDGPDACADIDATE